MCKKGITPSDRYVKSGLIMILLLITAVLPGIAAAGEEPALLLDDVTVTASPVIEANITDAYGARKTRVTEEQVEDLNAQDLETALRRTPGVNISRYNPIGSFGGAEGGGVFIRGMGSSRPGAEIKTLFDGIPMYLSVWNHPLLDTIPVDAAHAIEVYKSPQPQHFGNAFGVINVVPKRMETEGFVTKGQVATGRWSTLVGTVEHGGKKDKVDYYIGCGYRSSDGHRDEADGELKNVHASLGFALSPNWDLNMVTLWNDNEAKDPGEEGADPALREGSFETRTWLAEATLSNSYEHADGSVKVYWNGGEGDWLDYPAPTPGIRENLFNDSLFYGVKARETFYLDNGLEWLVGFDWDYSEGEYDKTFSDGSTDRWDGHDVTLFSPYTAVSRQFGSQEGFYAVPSAGVRYYDNTDFDDELAPHAGLVAGYKETEVHLSYARGVVYPGLEVVVFSEKVIPMLRDSWKDLNAEKVDHFEAGITRKFGDRAVVDVTFFYDDGTDRYVIVPPPPPPPVYDNTEEFTIKGSEITVSVNPTRNLSLFAGATFLDTDPGDMPYAPETTVTGGLNWRFLKFFTLSLDASYLSSMTVSSQARKAGATNNSPVDSYTLVNGQLSYAFHLPGMEGELFVAGENLTDESYEYLPGYPMPGLNLMGGIRFTL